MAKASKAKKREPSTNSRAARRAASPPSTLAAKSTASTKDADAQPWLYHTASSGISKKQKKPKVLSRQQRQRQQKSLEHALRNEDKLEQKVKESKRRGRKVQGRRAEWEELNGAAKKEVGEADLAVGEDVEGERESGKKAGWAENMVQVELEDVLAGMEGFEMPGKREGAADKGEDEVEVEVDVQAPREMDAIT